MTYTRQMFAKVQMENIISITHLTGLVIQVSQLLTSLQAHSNLLDTSTSQMALF